MLYKSTHLFYGYIIGQSEALKRNKDYISVPIPNSAPQVRLAQQQHPNPHRGAQKRRDKDSKYDDPSDSTEHYAPACDT